MCVVAVVRRAGLGRVYPPLCVGDELLAARRVVADGSEGVERVREEVEHAHRIFRYEFSYFMTITIDIDGRRLGQLITQEDDEIGLIPSWPRTLRWCGVASAGAELRISGPKPPASA